jgi:hypothetical protein
MQTKVNHPLNADVYPWKFELCNHNEEMYSTWLHWLKVVVHWIEDVWGGFSFYNIFHDFKVPSLSKCSQQGIDLRISCLQYSEDLTGRPPKPRFTKEVAKSRNRIHSAKKKTYILSAKWSKKEQKILVIWVKYARRKYRRCADFCVNSRFHRSIK